MIDFVLFLSCERACQSIVPMITNHFPNEPAVRTATELVMLASTFTFQTPQSMPLRRSQMQVLHMRT